MIRHHNIMTRAQKGSFQNFEIVVLVAFVPHFRCRKYGTKPHDLDVDMMSNEHRAVRKSKCRRNDADLRYKIAIPFAIFFFPDFVVYQGSSFKAKTRFSGRNYQVSASSKRVE